VNAARLLLVLSLLGPVIHLDHAVRDAVQHARGPALEGVMRTATDLGRPPVVVAGLAAIAFVDEAAGLVTARAALVTLLPVNLLVEVTKYAVNRVRPDGDTRRRNSSFPSGHAANAMALAWMLSRRWPRSRWAFFVLAAVISFSRIWLDRHFLSDVVVASLLGIGCAMLVVRLWPALDPARRAIAEPKIATAGERLL
jgi:membrane-associated phospholipid phosphatase